MSDINLLQAVIFIRCSWWAVYSQNFTQLNDFELHDTNGQGKSSASIQR